MSLKLRTCNTLALNVQAMQTGGAFKVETPLGIFQMLPREIFNIIYPLSNFSVKQLRCISLTSSKFNCEVQRYLLLENAHLKFLAETAACVEGDLADVDPFYLWGMLLKASTIIMNSEKRRSFFTSFFSKNEKITDWPGWGRCFMAFCEKWDFHECEKLMKVILHFTELSQVLSEILPEEVGKYPLMEMEIRQRLRGLFLTHSSTDDERDYGFWISALLRTQKTVKFQGKLFMILFGPIKITETKRAIPSAWSSYNFAALLALLPDMIHIALLKRLSEGRTNEAAYLFHAVKAVLHHWGIHVKTISNIMLKTFQALPPINRRMFFGSLLRAESYQLSGLLLDTPFNAERFHAELSSIRSTSALMTLLAKNV
uniref:F-box domain-containing protein n=1 Tax=Elaeophora elaphi TaxID=1147741 RepID=A0A0R3RUT5_9BILA